MNYIIRFLQIYSSKWTHCLIQYCWNQMDLSKQNQKQMWVLFQIDIAYNDMYGTYMHYFFYLYWKLPVFEFLFATFHKILDEWQPRRDGAHTKQSNSKIYTSTYNICWSFVFLGYCYLHCHCVCHGHCHCHYYSHYCHCYCNYHYSYYHIIIIIIIIITIIVTWKHWNAFLENKTWGI